MRAVLSSNPPSLIQFSYATSLPHQHHDPLLPQQFWNRLNHQRSSSKTKITMQPSCFSNSPPMMKPIWEDSWKDQCTLHIEITLNRICNKYNIYNCFLGIYKQRKWQMRKKERKKKKKSLKEKSLPNYEFKWKHDFPTYPCVCIYIMQWMHSVVQLKLYFLPTNEQHEDISLHITYVLIIKPTKKEEMNALHCMIISWLKNCYFMLTCLLHNVHILHLNAYQGLPANVASTNVYAASLKQNIHQSCYNSLDFFWTQNP